MTRTVVVDKVFTSVIVGAIIKYEIFEQGDRWTYKAQLP